jgi:adenylate cyclase
MSIQHNTDDTYEQALTREVLKSECYRLYAAVLLLILFFCVALVSHTLRPAIIVALFHRDLDYGQIDVLFLPAIFFELYVLHRLQRRLKEGGDLRTFERYIGVLIETSIPSVFLISQTHSGGTLAAFGFWTGLLYFLFISLSTLRLDFKLSIFSGVVAALETFAIAYYRLPLTWQLDQPQLFFGYHLSRSVVFLAAGCVAGYVGARIRQQFELVQEAVASRDRLNNLFGQHVSPAVVERLLDSGTAGASELRDVCVMFVDIRGFTAAAHTRSPAEVVNRLDDAFAILVEIVDQHHGVVNKFLGDGFLAIFGAPFADPGAVPNAVSAAYAMLESMQRANITNSWPLRLGIGIHVGPAVTGTVGSPRRKEYTVIGDTVNFASRLESLNKEYGSQLLVSDSVVQAARDSLGAADQVGPIVMRGYPEPVRVWRLA